MGAMNKTLLEQLPEIVRNGKRRAEQILESLEGRTRVGLQTRELVTPARDSNWKEFAAVRGSARASRAVVDASFATSGGESSGVSSGALNTAREGACAPQIWFNRLIDQNARPFLFQAIGDYQVEAARSTLGRKFRVGDLAHIVLGLYGALPLAAEESPGRNLGYMPSSHNGGGHAPSWPILNRQTPNERDGARPSRGIGAR